MASADFSLRFSAPWPFQAQGETSPGNPLDVPSATAGSTPPSFGRESFAGGCPLALVGFASYPVPVCRLGRSLHASFSLGFTAFRLAFRFSRYDQLLGGLSPPHLGSCWAHIPPAPLFQRGEKIGFPSMSPPFKKGGRALKQKSRVKVLSFFSLKSVCRAHGFQETYDKSPLPPLFQRGEHAWETSLFPPLKKGGRGDVCPA